jgi:hypothetical protein
MIRMSAFRRALPLVLAAGLLFAPGRVHAHQPARTPVELGLTTSFVTTTEVSGVEGGLQALWAPSRYFAAGAELDSAFIGASGLVSGASFRYRVSSTLLAVVAQGRLPLGPAMPYLQIGAGYLHTVLVENDHVGCGFDPGLGLGVATGVRLRLTNELAVGVRLSGRLAGAGMGCDAAPRHWHFRSFVLFGAGASLEHLF